MEQKASYIMPALTNALIIGTIFTAISLFVTYSTINSEPTGSMFNALMFQQLGLCLIGAIAGVLTVKAHVKTTNESLTLGNGALIGLVSGVLLSVVLFVLSLVWNQIIDPGMVDGLKDYMMTNMEMLMSKSGVSGDALDEILGNVEKGFEEQKTMVGMLKGFLYMIIGLGVVNVISGMITAKVTAKD